MLSFDIPWWIALAILAGLLIALVVGVLLTYVSIRGLYLLINSQTTSKTRIQAAAVCGVVSTVLLLVLLQRGLFNDLRMVSLVLSVPFGLVAGQLFYLLIESIMESPGWLMKGLFPFFTIVNIFLNFTGYISVVEFLRKRFGIGLK